MGAQCNLHNHLNPTIMGHLKSSSNSNHFFIFQKGFIFGGGRSLLPSPSSFALALPFLLVLPSYSCASVSSPINISFTKAISLCNCLDLFMASMTMSSFIAQPLLRLILDASIFFLASYSFLMHLLFSITFLVLFPLVG